MLNLARLALALGDAVRIGGDDGKAAMLDAARSIRDEVVRREQERAV